MSRLSNLAGEINLFSFTGINSEFVSDRPKTSLRDISRAMLANKYNVSILMMTLPDIARRYRTPDIVLRGNATSVGGGINAVLFPTQSITRKERLKCK